MSEATKIQWTDHTFNPWIGCTKVSDGCRNCYAEALMDKRWGKVEWGPRGERKRTSASNWREPVKWNRQAKAKGERARVFCASLADVFEPRDELDPWREDLFKLIYETPWLDWQILTKRPGFAADWLGGTSGAGLAALAETFPNVWMGTSVEDQTTADERIARLLDIPASVRFLSVEPLLGPVDLDKARCDVHDREHVQPHADLLEICGECAADGFSGEMPVGWWLDPCADARQAGINWVIVGGESGPGARPCDINWIRSIVGQCREAGVAAFVKQLGKVPFGSTPDGEDDACRCHHCGHNNLSADSVGFDVVGADPGNVFCNVCHSEITDGWNTVDSKGGDPAEWPADLQVRQFPEVAHG